MSKRVQTIEIEGYRQVTFKTLTKRQMFSIRAHAPSVDPEVEASEEERQIVLILKRALVAPGYKQLFADFAERRAELPNLIDDVATAIIQRSWPNEKAS